jgi:hypothetical protein
MAWLSAFLLGALLAVATTGTVLAEWSGAPKGRAGNTAGLTGNVTVKGSSANGQIGTTPVPPSPQKPRPTQNKK